ncbi:uncharacterized protein [Setaria viridis]|uniref:uncharacterized protein n=1 Tax=Setaria viridis TaxID=4556 RepID=UPI003B3A506E
MVATRGQGRKRSAEEDQDTRVNESKEPQKTDYERRRDAQIAENAKVFEALGLLNLSTEFNNSVPEPTTKKGKKSANQKTNSEDSDSSEFLLEDNDQGDSDDDDTESDEQPQPTKCPAGYKRKVLASKKKRVSNMAPGVRATKRVRAPQGSQVQPTRAELRTSKRLQLSARDGQSEHAPTDGQDEIPPSSFTDAEQGNGTGVEDIIATEEDSGAGAQDMIHADVDTEAPAQRAPRRPRPPTKGTQLDRMTKAMGRRMPVAVAEGKKRPHEPVQAAKFASEAGVIIRDKVPVLPHWKLYKKDDQHYKNFVGKLSGRLAINTNDKPTDDACTDVMRSGVRQRRYRLKQKYFNGVSANEISKTSPVNCMSDEQWRALVAKWSDPKNMETSEKNKLNRGKVKYHQTTGSRSYVAHLHAYHQRNNAEPSTDTHEELDVVEAFTSCHTSSKHGLSEPAREAVTNMEALRAQPVAEGETRVSSVQVVSQVLPKNSSNSFLKSVGIKPVGTSQASSSSNEIELREQLAAEAKAVVQDELEDLKKRSEEAEEKLARTERELEEMKKLTEINTKAMEENNALLKRILSLNNASLT